MMFQVFRGFGRTTSARRAVGMGSRSGTGFGSIRFLGRLTQLVLTFWMLLVGFSAHAGLPKPAYPVIFIHGLNSNSEASWGEFRRVLVENEWVYGGATRYEQPGSVLADRGTVKVWKDDPGNRTDLDRSSGLADFYTVNFSNNHELTFATQGFELGRIVKAVLLATGKSKVILVGHSMGGLAARAYLQGAGGYYLYGAPFNEDVHALITVGTPHQGSMEAKKCKVQLSRDQILLPSWATLICTFTYSSSIGPTSLNPESEAFVELDNYDRNQFQVSPIKLPISVAYTSVVATWSNRNTLSNLVGKSVSNTIGGTITKYDRVYGEEGDGIVTAKSQNLAELKLLDRTNIKHRTRPVIFPTDPPPGCGNQLAFGIVNEIHTCETGWPEVWDNLLRSILEIGDTDPFIPIVSTDSATRQFVTGGLDQVVLRGKAFHPTKWIQVTCRYGSDIALPAPLLVSSTHDINLPPIAPGKVSAIECVIPMTTLTNASSTVSTLEVPSLYYRVLASFTTASTP